MLQFLIPAKAGIHLRLVSMDSRVREKGRMGLKAMFQDAFREQIARKRAQCDRRGMHR